MYLSLQNSFERNKQRSKQLIIFVDYFVALGDCGVGTYISGDDCIPCEQGTYQDEPLKTECKSCGPEKNTAGPGSTSVDECTGNRRAQGVWGPLLKCTCN